LEKGSHLDSPTRENPEPYDHQTPFGKENKSRMTMGSPYKWKANDNPAPGQYDANSSMTKSQSQAFSIPKTDMKYRGRLEKGSHLDSPTRNNPTALDYDHLTPFGSEIK